MSTLTKYQDVGSRDEQEDSIVKIDNVCICELRFMVIGVIDGHGGTECNDFITSNLTRCIDTVCEDIILDDVDEDIILGKVIPSILYRGVILLEKIILTNQIESGSAVGLVFLNKKRNYIVNVGDVQTIIVYPKKRVEITPMLPKKKYIDANNTLNISSALGDNTFKQKYPDFKPYPQIYQFYKGYTELYVYSDGITLNDISKCKYNINNFVKFIDDIKELKQNCDNMSIIKLSRNDK